MARGQSVYQGAYNFPVQSTAAQSIMQGAQAQAQMYSSLGQALGKVANTYFEKKDEDKQIDAIVDNPEILDLVYRGQTDMPADPKERRKDVKALFKGLGGREGVENYLLRDRAERRAASAEQRAEDMLAMQQEKHDMEKKQQRLRNEVLMEAFSSKQIPLRLEGEMFPKGGTVGDMFPGLKPQPTPTEPTTTEPIRFEAGDLSSLPIEFQVQKGLKPTAQPEPSYASRLMGKVRGGIRTAREKLADVEMPDIPLAKEVTVEGKMPFQERSMEGVIESLQKSGLGQEHMPYILELAKLRPSRASLGSIGISEALGDKTFFSEAEAANEYRRVARENDYTPTQAGIDNFVKTARVVKPEEIKDSVWKDFKELKLSKPYEVLQNLTTTNSLLESAKGKMKESGNPLAGQAAIRQVARMFEPSGPLTEDDIKPFAGSQALTAQLKSVLKKVDDGTIHEDDLKHLQDIVDTVSGSARDTLSEKIPIIAEKAAKRFKVTEEQVKEFTYLSDLMPKDAGQPSGDPSDLADDIYQNIRKQPVGSKIELPLHGSGQIIAHFPNGIIHVKLEATGRIHELDGKNLNATPEPPPPRNPRIQKPPEFDLNDPDVGSYKFK